MTKQHNCTEERFLNDVKDHKINIVSDSELHRNPKKQVGLLRLDRIRIG
jgi:hypothetical protein